jgi:phosphoribosyl-dephospho-CoA transferase
MIRGDDAFRARTDAVRRFRANELLNRDEGVALLCVTVTASGEVRMHAIGADPVHAQILLD